MHFVTHTHTTIVCDNRPRCAVNIVAKRASITYTQERERLQAAIRRMAFPRSINFCRRRGAQTTHTHTSGARFERCAAIDSRVL